MCSVNSYAPSQVQFPNRQFQAAPVVVPAPRAVAPIFASALAPVAVPEEPIRVPKRFQEIVHVKAAGQVKQIVQRLPAPLPDVIERLTIVHPNQDIINVITERPPTPPPQIIKKTVVEPKMPPIINYYRTKLTHAPCAVPQAAPFATPIQAPLSLPASLAAAPVTTQVKIASESVSYTPFGGARLPQHLNHLTPSFVQAPSPFFAATVPAYNYYNYY
jgi:hypothetical protein